MLSEEEFSKRYIARLARGFGKWHKVEQWMRDIAPDAYEMWVDDDPNSMTPEDMADEEADEMKGLG